MPELQPSCRGRPTASSSTPSSASRRRAGSSPISPGSGSAICTPRRLTMARPGSSHGYDVIDFNRLNPELGDEAAFEALVAELHAHGMGLLLDFVPNHMGVGADNPWWLDVLEWGQESPFASFFDIDWEASARGVRDKVLLPVLGDQYGLVLEAGELQLAFDAAGRQLRRPLLRERLPDRAHGLPATAAGRRRSLRQRRRRADRARLALRRARGRRQFARAARGQARGGGGAQGGARGSGRAMAARGRRSRRRPRGSTARPASRTAFAPCTGCSRSRPTGSPTGGSRAPRSTTGASSRSTSSPACAWSGPRSSRRPISSCFA